ncbi:class I SAM-dependent methyltransferase [Pseudotabrizicola sp. L79]|uniref:class I SAM-dependent methyltransferase n=1 Tax=Pseudotabrizicola sp. L79 TaxID=3118402 RepID=UPI002F93F045
MSVLSRPAPPVAQTRQQRFWNRFADRYAARQIKDVTAYEALLTAVTARLKPGDHVLEIGCGTGGTAIRLSGGVASYIATDFSQEMIRIAQSKPAPDTLCFVVATADSALHTGPFDAICAFNVLHLVDDLPTVLQHCRDQLKPDGLLISKTWCFADLPLKLRVLFVGLRLIGLFPDAASLSQQGLQTALSDAGFEIVEHRAFGSRPQNPYIVAKVKQPDQRH